jgi:hypothetical protein
MEDLIWKKCIDFAWYFGQWCVIRVIRQAIQVFPEVEFQWLSLFHCSSMANLMKIGNA